MPAPTAPVPACGLAIDRHPERLAIIEAIITGQSQLAIAKQYHISRSTVAEFMRARLTPAAIEVMRENADAKRREPGEIVIERIESMVSAMESIVSEMHDDSMGGEDAWKDRRYIAISAARELRGGLELLAKVYGKLVENRSLTVNITTAQVWAEIRPAIIRATQDAPEVLARIVQELEEEPC